MDLGTKRRWEDGPLSEDSLIAKLNLIAAQIRHEDDLPNIVFIFADNLGYGELGG